MRRTILGEFWLGAKPLQIEGLTTTDIHVSKTTEAQTLTGRARAKFRHDERATLNVQRLSSWAVALALTATAVGTGIRSEKNGYRIDSLETLIEGREYYIPGIPVPGKEYSTAVENQEYEELNADQTKWQIGTGIAGGFALLAGINALMAGSRRKKYNSKSFETYLHTDTPYVSAISSKGTAFYYPKPEVKATLAAAQPLPGAE